MANRFEVSVTAKGDRTLSLKVEALSTELGVPPANPSFVLRLLRDKATAAHDLARAVALEDLEDDRWLKQYTKGFVSAVKATGDGSRGKPRATLEVTVTNPAWISHVEKGDKWTSGAQPITADSDMAPPFAPEGPAEVYPDQTGAFLYLPPFAWGGTLESAAAGAGKKAVADIPKVLEIPAYSPSAYTITDKISKPKEIPEAWLGSAVRVKAWEHPEDGALVGRDGGTARWATMRPGSYGDGGGKVEWIGKLALKVGRRGTRLSYAKILGRQPARRHEITVAGKIAYVKYRVPPGPFTIGFDSASAVLDYLAAGIPDDAGPSAPLRRALATDMVADHYISKYAIDTLATHDLDALPIDLVKAMLTSAWPIVSVRITATDPKWLAHLEQYPPPEQLPLVVVK